MQNQVERFRGAEQSREALGPARAGNDADARLGQSETELTGHRQSEVATERELEAAAGGAAVDRGHRYERARCNRRMKRWNGCSSCGAGAARVGAALLRSALTASSPTS